MNSEKKIIELNKIILEMLDGSITPQRFEQLDKMIAEDTEVAAHYAELIAINSSLCKPGSVGTYVLDHEVWNALAEDEKSAIAIKVEKDNDRQREYNIDNKFTAQSRSRRISKLSLTTAIISSAALILLLAYVWFAPQRPAIVAMLTETAGAKWGNPALPSSVGSDLRQGKRFLKEGFAKILFNKGAEVLIEAPCQFELENDDQIFLICGKLFSKVPPEAKGFIVRTSSAAIVDYGTEFGVTADADGKTEAYVFSGNVELRSGTDPARFTALKKLVTGMAGKVDHSGEISTHEFDPASIRFARNIADTDSFGLPGVRMDLADIIGGGNGFGSGGRGYILDGTSGKLIQYANLKSRGWFFRDDWKVIYDDAPDVGDGKYIGISWHDYIDGVFVPDCGNGPVQISSMNHYFDTCPDTDNRFWGGITNSGKIADGKNTITYHSMSLGGNSYGSVDKPGIFLHANTGITFDLQKIRQALPNVMLTSFSTKLGIEDTEAGKSRSDFWILVDGKIRFHKFNDYKEVFNHRNINLELNPTDRFLTLITTDGGDGNSHDWCVLAMPALELKSSEKF